MTIFKVTLVVDTELIEGLMRVVRGWVMLNIQVGGELPGVE
jgi:hypothetical protein